MDDKIVINWNGSNEYEEGSLVDALCSLKVHIHKGKCDPYVFPPSFVVAYVCEECGRVLPFTMACPHSGPDLLGVRDD